MKYCVKRELFEVICVVMIFVWLLLLKDVIFLVVYIFLIWFFKIEVCGKFKGEFVWYWIFWVYKLNWNIELKVRNFFYYDLVSVK